MAYSKIRDDIYSHLYLDDAIPKFKDDLISREDFFKTLYHFELYVKRTNEGFFSYKGSVWGFTSRDKAKEANDYEDYHPISFKVIIRSLMQERMRNTFNDMTLNVLQGESNRLGLTFNKGDMADMLAIFKTYEAQIVHDSFYPKKQVQSIILNSFNNYEGDIRDVTQKRLLNLSIDPKLPFHPEDYLLHSHPKAKKPKRKVTDLSPEQENDTPGNPKDLSEISLNHF